MSRMLRMATTVALAVLGASAVLAQELPSCSLTKKCPESAPCCSQYGQCGVGAYCLGGCDPRMSFTLDSCVAAPVCQSRSMSMNNLERIVDRAKYLGDASKADWVSQGRPLAHNGNVLLTMPARSAGTVLASTVYMWYGNVKARIKTSRGAGVVTAFILFSDVKDEIDFEWIGNSLANTQTNYYFQGITDYTNGGNISQAGVTNTNTEWHTYEIRWTPDKIEWYVDGRLGRTQLKSETWDAAHNQWAYPQTPSRVQLSLWPGGDEKNPEGTRDWAGGLIDWSSEDILRNGYYYATVGEITMECYQTDTAPGTNLRKGYVYKDAKATNDTIEDSDTNTILKSLLGTGLDMEKDYPSSGAAQTTQAVIPGLSGGGPGTNGQAAESSSGDSNSPTVVGGSPNAACTASFEQVCGAGEDNTSQNQGVRQERALGASTFAALVAVAGVLWL
ncbi:hypothetical protein GGS23DRAFT_613725 [Durotheca rogersii]|uniref:uncharacterized protein n=1 Tax=Durotheca rogersii TaxID=419775 RepID=UPI00221F1E90|nr:uncharacterized protein GGS23DRAFT_613725 [Durotheca rogersii]KAI5860483.1 hypothetical protein GGS23DRAFT_613725 [Durotheca rogersii]